MPKHILLLALLAPALHAEINADRLIEARAAEYRAQKQHQQDELHAATLPLFIASLARAKTLILHASPPQQQSEIAPSTASAPPAPLTPATITGIHGSRLTPTPAPLSPADTDRLRSTLGRPESYRPSTGPKFCDPRHQNHAIAWSTDARSYHALVCFDCQTIQLVSETTHLTCDLPAPTQATLAPLLQTPTTAPPPQAP